MLMLPTGRTVIQEVMHRCDSIEGIDRCAIVIPDRAGDIALHDHVIGSLGWFTKPWHVYVGPEDDVRERFRRVASVLMPDHIMRITADCPCIAPEICGQVLAQHLDEGNDFTSNVSPRSFPQGYDCEVFARKMLWVDVGDQDRTKLAKEHVTHLMYDRDLWRVGNVAQEKDESSIRLTLDTIDDYIRICDHMSLAGQR